MTLAPLAVLLPAVDQPDEHLGGGKLQFGLGLRRIEPVGAVDRVANRHRGFPGRKPNSSTLRLVLRVVHHGLPEGEGSLALYVVHPVSVEDVRRVVREERSLLRIHRHQWHIWWLEALVPGVCWIATVVGEDADLLYGDRRDIAQRPPARSSQHVVEERRVSVVNDNPRPR